MHEEYPERPQPPSEKRLDEIFGRDLGTDDHEERGVPETPEERPTAGQMRERWYRENRPPHHDR